MKNISNDFKTKRNKNMKNISNDFKTNWKQSMLNKFVLKYGDNIDLEKINKYLDNILDKEMYDPPMQLNNNYLFKIYKCRLTDIYKTIKEKKPIIGGNGVLFKQHKGTENPYFNWIQFNMKKRSLAKASRKKYNKGSDEYNFYDIIQLNTKRKINSAYGAMGYKGFMFFNIFLAQSVTSFGQNAISAACCGFEAFMVDNLDFVTPDECYQFIENCIYELIDENVLELISNDDIYCPTKEETCVRILSKIRCKLTSQIENTIREIINNLTDYERKIVYYKNNLYSLINNDFIKLKLKNIINSIPELLSPDLSKINNKDTVNDIKLIWEYMKTYIIYDYPIYDRIRKAKYTSKNAVIYIDTDSNFLSLYKWVDFFKNNILATKSIDNNETFKIVNIYTIFLTYVADLSFGRLARASNVAEDYVSLLKMKNEFYFKRIVFVNTKKRYLGLQVLQEGVLLNNGIGLPEIKGFDFIKSTTKPIVKDFYEKLSLDEILYPENINLESIFIKIVQFETELRDSLRNGDTRYFKQSNIKQISEYARPYSIQGIKAILLWNTLNPSYAMQLPTDVDIVPIKLELGRHKRIDPKEVKPGYVYIGKKDNKMIYIDNETKILNEFNEKYPDIYKLLSENILYSDNQDIRALSLNYIAKPKNPEIPIPEWFYDIMDSDKIVNDTLNLYYPILKSLGINIMDISSTESHYTNIVAL